MVYFLPVSNKGGLPVGVVGNEGKVTLSCCSLTMSSKKLSCRFIRNDIGYKRWLISAGFKQGRFILW